MRSTSITRSVRLSVRLSKPLGSTLALLTITPSSLVRLLRNFAQIFRPTSFIIHTKQIFNISIWRCSITQFVCKMTNFILSITPVSLACSLSNFAQICRTMSFISFIKRVFLYLNPTLLHSSICQSTFRAVLGQNRNI